MWYQYLCLYLSIYHIYIIQYYSAFKNERNIGICSNMDGPGDYHTKWSKSDRERQTSYDITYVWYLKYNSYESIYEKETESQTQKKKLMAMKGEQRGSRDKLGVCD